MTFRQENRRAAAPLALLAALALAACAGRSGLPADAAPPAAASAAAPAEAEPLTPGIVPLTLEQEREVE